MTNRLCFGSARTTMAQAASSPISEVHLHDVGHYVAMEAPEELAEAILTFIDGVDEAAHRS
jgi:pimeloyl-ACP methyl ester carboxylesterase